MIYTRYKHYIIGKVKGNTWQVIDNSSTNDNWLIAKDTLYECIQFINRYTQTNKTLKEI